MADEEKDNVCLAILDTNEDGILISRPFFKDCAIKKLKAIRFCRISNKEAKELIDLYKSSKCMSLRQVRIKCECK